MIFREALRSVKDDLFRSLFFFLTFFLTTVFIFLFFNLSFEIGEEGIMTLVTVFMVIICTVDIFFVNHFYMTSKAKDLAVRLICGATYTYLSFYLLIQVAFLLLLALPAGIGVGYALMPVINNLLGTSIVITGDAMVRIAVVIGLILFWILLFNLSFTYKSAASMMFNMQSELVSGKSNVLTVRGGEKAAKLKRIVLFPLYLLPLVLLFDSQKPSYVCAGFGVVLFSFLFADVWVPYLNKKMETGITDPMKAIHIGFHRMNVRSMKKNILLVNGSTLFVYALLDQAQASDVFVITVILSCCMVSVLMWLAYLFQYENEQGRRVTKLTTLLHIGYTKDQLTSILRKEVFSIYGTTLMFFLIYFIPITVSHFSRNAITAGQLILVCASYLVPLVLCMLVSLRTYTQAVKAIRTVK